MSPIILNEHSPRETSREELWNNVVHAFVRNVDAPKARILRDVRFLPGNCSMKLLLYSHFLAPSVGGVESIVLSLARGLTEVRTPEGLVLAENMSRGLPVVASNLGSFVEVLGDAGLTFRVGDAQALAGQIVRFLDDSALASVLTGRARTRIFDRYLRSHMIEAHAQLYRRLRCAEQA